eukprot:g7938.t2
METGSNVGSAWVDDMISKGFVRRRRGFLPPHAGGVPASLHVGSPIEMIHTPDAAGVVVGGSNPPRLAPVPQLAQETSSSRSWLEGPLRECARKAGDDGALARSLLDAGAATDSIDRAGRSPLHWACTRGNTAVAVALLDAGADGLARDGAGKTPLHCAAQVGHTHIVHALLDSYAFVPAPHGSRAPAVRAAMMSIPAAAGKASSTAAMQQHDEGLVSILDARNAYGSTALHRAAFNGRDGVVLALLRGGAGVSVVGSSGRTALHLACQNAHPACVGMLLAWGADESARANDGSTPWTALARAAECRPAGCPRVAETGRLLNVARGSRAWGRRGWLLMLKEKHNRQVARQMTTKAERGTEMVLEGGGAGGDWAAAPGTTAVCRVAGDGDNMEVVVGKEAKEEEGESGDDLTGLAYQLAVDEAIGSSEGRRYCRWYSSRERLWSIKPNKSLTWKRKKRFSSYCRGRGSFHIQTAPKHEFGEAADLLPLEELHVMLKESLFTYGPTVLPRLLDADVVGVLLNGVSGRCYHMLHLLSGNDHVVAKMGKDPSYHAPLIAVLARQLIRRKAAHAMHPADIGQQSGNRGVDILLFALLMQKRVLKAKRCYEEDPEGDTGGKEGSRMPLDRALVADIAELLVTPTHLQANGRGKPFKRGLNRSSLPQHLRCSRRSSALTLI